MKFKEHLEEASASQAVERGKILQNLLDTDAIDKLKDVHMKIQKEASKIFQQAINLIRGLK